MTVRDVRRILIVVLLAMAAVDLAALGLLLSPAGRSRSERISEFNRLRAERVERSREVLPAQGMDKKLELARQQEATFSKERLPQRYSEMSQVLYSTATASGVQVGAIKYDNRSLREQLPPGFQHVTIAMQVRGSYANDMHFINALERQKTLFLIDGVNFGGMEGDTLQVVVSLSTYMRTGA